MGTATAQIGRNTTSFSSALFGTTQQPLAQYQVTSRFSLLEDHVMAIAAAPGMILFVRRGTLRIGREGERRGHWLVAGARFVAERDERVTLSSPETVELAVEWPQSAGTEFAPRAS